MIEPLNSLNPDHRQAMTAALVARGLDAQEECSGGNVWRTGDATKKGRRNHVAPPKLCAKPASGGGARGEESRYTASGRRQRVPLAATENTLTPRVPTNG